MAREVARRQALRQAGVGYVVMWLGGQTWNADLSGARAEALRMSAQRTQATVYPVRHDGTLGEQVMECRGGKVATAA